MYSTLLQNASFYRYSVYTHTAQANVCATTTHIAQEFVRAKTICWCYCCIPSYKLCTDYKRRVQCATVCSSLLLLLFDHGDGWHTDHLSTDHGILPLTLVLNKDYFYWLRISLSMWMMTTAHERDSTSQ